jgi:outer membrane autotransporter protein
VRNSLISSRSSITLVLAIACVALAVMWPGWLTAFRAEGAYQPQGDVSAAAGGAAVATASVQNTNISIRLGALRGEIPTPAGSGSGASADPVHQLDFGRLGLFLNGLGSFGDQQKTPRELGFDFHTGGFLLGGDYKLTNNLILGAALGYLNTRAQLDDSAGHVTNNGYNLSAFGTYYIANTMHVDGIATYTWNAYDLERNVQSASETARGHPDGNQFALSVGSGYDFHVGALTAGPTFRVNYLNIFIDGYRERGAATSDLKVNSQTITSVTTDLGAQVTYAISVPFGVLSPTVRFEWEHEFENNSRTITSHSVVDPGSVLTVKTNGPDRDYFNLGAGVSATFKRGMSTFFYYEAVLGRNNFTNNSFTAGLRFEF